MFPSLTKYNLVFKIYKSLFGSYFKKYFFIFKNKIRLVHYFEGIFFKNLFLKLKKHDLYIFEK